MQHKDTTLLEQIIDVEVDIKLHQLMLNESVTFPKELVHYWKNQLLEDMYALAMDRMTHHCLEPGALQRQLHDSLEEYIADERSLQHTDDQTHSTVAIPSFHPFSLFTNMLAFRQKPPSKKPLP